MDDFIAVIVLYKIGLGESNTFLSLKRSLHLSNVKLDLLVYDNTPEYNSNTISAVIKNMTDSFDITYHPDETNSGVSKAYNLAHSIGKVKSKKWLLLLDQDTAFPENTIATYTDTVKAYPDDKIFAPIMRVDPQTIISPCLFKYMRGFSLKTICTGVNSLKQLSVINCGMCISMNSFEKNGGYNEDIKLDFSDHDFIKRFKETVTGRFIVIDLNVYHELSTTIKNSFENDYIRFKYYLSGATKMSASATEKITLQANAFLRASKLAVYHKTFKFIKLFLNETEYGT